MIDKKNLKPGIYLVHWNADSAQQKPSIATIGFLESEDTFWIACSHWLEGSLNISKIEYAIDKLESIAAFEPENTSVLSKTDSQEAPQTKDAINPAHYKNYPVESIEMMLRVFGPTATYWHCILTAYKYRMRLGHKDEIKQELEKESWYLNRAAELKENFKHEILTKI